MKQIGHLHKIDEMLQEGSLTQVKDILNHAERDFEKARDSVDACISSAYPDLVHMISTFCNVQNASNDVFHLFESIKKSQQNIHEALIHSTKLNIGLLPNGLIKDYRYETMSYLPLYPYHDIYSWLNLNEEWTCVLNNILQRISKSNDLFLSKNEHSMLLQFFFDIPRRMTHLLLSYHSLPAFFILVFLAPKLFQCLKSSQQWRHEEEYHQFKTRHELFCYSKNFKTLFQATAYKSFQKLYPLCTFDNSLHSTKTSFNCCICSCSICQHFLDKFSHFNTLRDFENLFVISLCDNLPKQQCISIFVRYRQELINQLIQILQDPPTFPPATNACQLLALYKNKKTTSEDSIPSSCEIQLLFMSYCIAAVINLIETSIACLNFFIHKETCDMFDILSNFVRQDVENTIEESPVYSANETCSCMFCETKQSPLYWHIWVDGTHLPKQAEYVVEHFSLPTWKVFEKTISDLIQAFNNAMVLFVGKDDDDCSECFDLYQLEFLISLLITFYKASDIRDYMVHPFFEKQPEKKQDYFFYYHLNLKSLSQKQVVIRNHWNSLFLPDNDSSQDTFLTCFLHHWNQCVSRKIQHNVCVKLQDIFSKKHIKSSHTIATVIILNQMNEFLHLEYSKAQNPSSVSFFFHKTFRSNHSEKTLDEKYNSIKCEYVVMGLFDFIEKEVSLIPLIECHETSKTILSKMILSNNIFVLPLLLLILKSENTQDWIKSTYHGFKNIAVQLQSQSFSTSLYKKFQLCKSTVSQAKQNLFETYWQQVFHYESQCFCECLYEDIMNCQIMMVRQHELNVENNTMLHEAIFLNDENLSRTHQNVATKHSEQTECLQQMENDFTQNNFEKSFEKGQSPSVEVSCKRNSGNNDHLGDCGNIFLNEIDRNKRGPYEENDIWFPTKVSDALFTLLYTANHHLSVLYEEAKVLLSSFPHSIMESFQEEIRTSLVHYLDQLASDMYLHLWTNKHLFDFPQHLRLNAVAQCLLDISTIRLLYPVNKDYRLSATEKYLREEYLEDIIDQIIFTESKITYAAQCFLETCRFLLLPLLVCHNIQRGLVPMKAEHEGMLCRVNDLCEVEKKKIQLIKDACQVNEVVWEEKEKNNSKDNSVVTKLNTCSNIQSQHMVSPCKKTNAKSDKTPYLNVSSFSSFLRGQVEELSSKVSEVMKQRSSNNNPL